MYKVVGLVVFLMGASLSAQVGIGTTNPQATLDIFTVDPSNPSETDGILIPRVDEFPTTSPGASQDGMMLFVTGNGTVEKGLYFWDNSIPDWVSFLTASAERIDDLLDGKSGMNGSSLFLGIEAGENDDENGNRNIGIGFQALQSNENTVNNIAVGWRSLNALESGGNNTVVGESALRFADYGLNNVAIGKDAMRDAGNDISRSVAVGVGALGEVVSNGSVAVGYHALRSTTTGSQNTGVGTEANFRNTSGGNNAVFGYRAMRENVTGSGNVVIGSNSMRENLSGEQNVSIGQNAMRFTESGNENVVIGRGALATLPNGDEIVAIGSGALLHTTDASNKLAIGHRALASNVTSPENTAIGYLALTSLQSGDGGNTAIGERALENTTIGSQNTAIGYQTMGTNTIGQANSAYGYRALGLNVVGNDNVAIGYHAGRNITGSQNVIIGKQAGRGDADDLNAINGNIFIGYQAGYFETNSNRLYIQNSDADEENALVYGEFDNNLLRFNGAVGIDRNPTTNALEVNGEASKTTAGAFVANSDKRLKKNIETIQGKTALDLIAQMNGVTYEWNDDVTGNNRPNGMQYGFIAQELKTLFPEKVTLDAQGFYQTAYGDYDALFVQAIKELKEENELLKEQIIELKKLTERLQAVEGFMAKYESGKLN